MSTHPCTTVENTEIQNGLLTCLSCGAYQRLNPETGNITWIRSGRVISAPQDMLEAQQRHDERWPDSKIGA